MAAGRHLRAQGRGRLPVAFVERPVLQIELSSSVPGAVVPLPSINRVVGKYLMWPECDCPGLLKLPMLICEFFQSGQFLLAFRAQHVLAECSLNCIIRGWDMLRRGGALLLLVFLSSHEIRIIVLQVISRDLLVGIVFSTLTATISHPAGSTNQQ